MSYNDPYNNSSRRGDEYRGDESRGDGYRGNEYRGDDGNRRRDDYDSSRRNDNYEGSNPAYNPPPERAEYGGGGSRGSGNYYDSYNTNAYTDDDRSAVLSHAQQHGSSADDDTSIFSHALDFLGGNKAAITAHDNIDEQAAIGAHQAVYGGGEGGQRHSSETLGAGAALQALKMFTGGSGGGSHGAGGNSQAQLIGMAMGQASKLWEEQNGKGNVVRIFFFSVSLFSPLAFKNLRLNSITFSRLSCSRVQSSFFSEKLSIMFSLSIHPIFPIIILVPYSSSSSPSSPPFPIPRLLSLNTAKSKSTSAPHRPLQHPNKMSFSKPEKWP